MEGLSGIRILVVDDQPDARHLIHRALSRSGAEVHTAASVGEALDAVAVSPPDLLISDLSMPERDGYDLIRSLRAGPRTRHLPAIAVSGHTDLADADRSLREGFQAHFGKPVNLRRLVDAAIALTAVPEAAP